ncbi:MAG: ECF transporter S component [Clostridia bacterium]|nr:ECF transporter S component [Clostridia bacterium]
MRKKQFNAYAISFVGMMSAIVCVVTLFRFPLGGSKVHFANAMCLLGGMLFGPFYGGLAAGLGSAIYDAFVGGYDILNVLITFVSKFAMGWLCGVIVWHKGERSESFPRAVIAAAVGALTYVALYMFKSLLLYGWAGMVSRFPASILNAGVAIVAAPLLFRAMMPAMRGLLHKAGLAVSRPNLARDALMAAAIIAFVFALTVQSKNAKLAKENAKLTEQVTELTQQVEALTPPEGEAAE